MTRRLYRVTFRWGSGAWCRGFSLNLIVTPKPRCFAAPKAFANCTTPTMTGTRIAPGRSSSSRPRSRCKREAPFCACAWPPPRLCQPPKLRPTISTLPRNLLRSSAPQTASCASWSASRCRSGSCTILKLQSISVDMSLAARPLHCRPESIPARESLNRFEGYLAARFNPASR